LVEQWIAGTHAAFVSVTAAVCLVVDDGVDDGFFDVLPGDVPPGACAPPTPLTTAVAARA
jgi:hypothetical protein